MTKAQTKNPALVIRPEREMYTEQNNTKASGLPEERSRVHLAVAEKPHLWRRALYRSSLPASALRVGLALVDRYLNRKHGRCDPSHETLAEECGMSVRTVRDGLGALRASGLISTRKQGLQGTLFFYFAIPSNAAEIQQVVDEVQCGEDPSLNLADFRRASDGFPASNLRGTFQREPSNDLTSCGPPSAVVAVAPRFDQDLTRTANVVGDDRPLGSKGGKREKDEVLRAPSNPTDRITAIEAMLPDIARNDAIALAEWWNLFPKTMGELEVKASKARAAHE